MIIKILDREFDSDSEAWRHMCEALHVYRAGSLHGRLYLSDLHDVARRAALSETVANITPEFALEAEAAWVARMPTKIGRRERLRIAEDLRGYEYADKLRARAKALWEEAHVQHN